MIDLIFSGTSCTGGEACAVVTHTGMHTELGRIAALLQRGATVHSPLEKQVHRATRVIAAASRAIGAAFVPAGLLWQTVEPGSRARPLRPRGPSVIDRGLLTRAWLLLGGVSAVLFIGGFLLTFCQRTGTLETRPGPVQRCTTPTSRR